MFCRSNVAAQDESLKTPAEMPERIKSEEGQLLSDGVIPVDPTPKKAMVHHALPKEEKKDCQDDDKQAFSHPQPARFLSRTGRPVGVVCHLLPLDAGSRGREAFLRVVLRSSKQARKPPHVFYGIVCSTGWILTHRRFGYGFRAC
jgi:hypothetical protein